MFVVVASQEKPGFFSGENSVYEESCISPTRRIV